MSDMMKKALEAGRAKAELLTEATVKLGLQIEAAERAIAGLKLGVTGRVPFGDPEEQRFLAWGKENNQWRLLHEHGEFYELLTSAPRFVRLQAVDALPRLLHALVSEIDGEQKKVEEAVADIDDFIDEVALHAAGKAKR